ncbi:MAG: SDR family oxidoreductase [Gemmatimonadetes bacterium]|nr:SDR family oxidoreductase [Gemmatimonadota bacterium]
MKNTALITGASSGIGRELARIHATRGRDTILVARREERLQALADELRGEHGVESEILACDLADAAARRGLIEEIERRGIAIDYLINNAGFGGHGPFSERPWESDLAMIQVNVLAVAELTRAFLPAMLERGAGRILHVASTAGFLPGPLQATYYASKAYVVSFGQAVAEEIRGSGVTITTLCPGFTETEFVARADLADLRMLEGRSGPGPRPVAEHGYRAMERGKTLTIHGLGNRILIEGATRVLPRGVLLPLSHQSMKKKSAG